MLDIPNKAVVKQSMSERILSAICTYYNFQLEDKLSNLSLTGEITEKNIIAE